MKARRRDRRDYAETWDGGFVRYDSKGRKVFVIRRMIGGVNYKVSTRAHTESAAMEQLKQFEADPAGYRPGGSKSAAIYLDDALVDEYMKWSRETKKNSLSWRSKQLRFLAWWGDELEGLDLRRVSLTADIQPALTKVTGSRNHRIAVLKAFYAWLRKEKHVLLPQQDPTLGTLTVPQAKPEQWRKPKAIPREHYLEARKHLVGHWRDAMDVQAATGWHVTETVRFAEDGSFESCRTEEAGVAGVLVSPRGKNGEVLKTKVSAEALEAGKRLRAHGGLDYVDYIAAVAQACDAAGVPVFTPGRFRHSVATWAVEQGADLQAVSTFLNHKSFQTTKRFYATLAVPKKVPTLL